MSTNGIVTLSLVLDAYKTKKCEKKCEQKTCVFYHGDRDLKRQLREVAYSKNKCPTNCTDPKCSFANNVIEQKYHPEAYKKKYCKDFVMMGYCGYQDCCSLSHSDEELRIKPLHLMSIDLNFMYFFFKTVYCPFSWEKHNAFSCVYAHNWQDFKRPYFQNQISKICPNWPTKGLVLDYLAACPQGFQCLYCHGWKEFEYHPQRFKSVPCNKCPEPVSGFQAIQLQSDKTNPLLNLEAINRHVCCYSHAWENHTVKTNFEEFYLTKPNLASGPQTLSIFLQEVLGPKLNIHGGAKKHAPKTMVVDFFAFVRNVENYTIQPDEIIKFRSQKHPSLKPLNPNIQCYPPPPTVDVGLSGSSLSKKSSRRASRSTGKKDSVKQDGSTQSETQNDEEQKDKLLKQFLDQLSRI